MSATQTEQRFDPVQAVRPDTPGLTGFGKSAEAESGPYVAAMMLIGLTWIVACVALFGWAMILITG